MTTIQWTDETWNPVTGCTKVSEGCRHCYAEKLFPRIYGGDFGGRKFTEVMMHPDRLNKPLHWRKPRRVFVNSMSDLFHEDVPDEFITDVFDVMAQAEAHTFQVLTKRPARMREFCRNVWGCGFTLPNVWLGVSVEDQESADERIALLLDTPAAVRFVSAEPLLGPVDLDLFRGCRGCNHPGTIVEYWNEHGRCHRCDGKRHERPDWVIVGGESGPKARPCDVAWIRSIVDQCREADVACFVKQLGGHPFIDLGEPQLAGTHQLGPWSYRVNRDYQSHGKVMLRDRKGGDPAEWPEDLRVREMPNG